MLLNGNEALKHKKTQFNSLKNDIVLEKNWNQPSHNNINEIWRF